MDSTGLHGSEPDSSGLDSSGSRRHACSQAHGGSRGRRVDRAHDSIGCGDGRGCGDGVGGGGRG